MISSENIISTREERNLFSRQEVKLTGAHSAVEPKRGQKKLKNYYRIENSEEKEKKNSQNSPLCRAGNGLSLLRPVQLYPINKTLHIHPSTSKSPTTTTAAAQRVVCYFICTREESKTEREV